MNSLCPPASSMMQEEGKYQREDQPWAGLEDSVDHDGQEGYFESAGNFGSADHDGSAGTGHEVFECFVVE